MNGTAREHMESRLRTATPLEMVVIVYEGIIHFLVEGRIAMQAFQVEKKTNALNRASRFMAELQFCLNLEKGGEVALHLAGLYDYCQKRLMEANLRNSVEIVDEVLALVRNLLDAWSRLSRAGNAAPGALPPDPPAAEKRY
ncbi:MAG: flagellar export chaperone FliS [Acidobacteria bacterium]|nr:flagellar export chaperone FliS [Acidobacteriota bacterium]